jgi:hypothetical protein
LDSDHGLREFGDWGERVFIGTKSGDVRVRLGQQEQIEQFVFTWCIVSLWLLQSERLKKHVISVGYVGL